MRKRWTLGSLLLFFSVGIYTSAVSEKNQNSAIKSLPATQASHTAGRVYAHVSQGNMSAIRIPVSFLLVRLDLLCDCVLLRALSGSMLLNISCPSQQQVGVNLNISIRRADKPYICHFNSLTWKAKSKEENSILIEHHQYIIRGSDFSGFLNIRTASAGKKATVILFRFSSAHMRASTGGGN